MGRFDPAAWAKAHKPQAAAGALAGLAGLVYLTKRRQAAAGAAQGGAFTAPTDSIGTQGGAPFDSTANDLYNSFEAQLEAFEQQVGAGNTNLTPVTTGTTVQTPTGPVVLPPTDPGTVPVITTGVDGNPVITGAPIGGGFPTTGTIPVGTGGGTVTFSGGAPVTVTSPTGVSHPIGIVTGTTGLSGVGVIATGGARPAPKHTTGRF